MNYRNFKSGALTMLLLSGGTLLYAQQRIQVNGKVLSKDGVSLPGTSITVKDNRTGQKAIFSAGDKGLFQLKNIKVNELYNLYFEHLGYLPDSVTNFRVYGNENNALLIRLIAKEQRLDDVIVIGYGTQSKSNITGAISSVKAKDLVDMPVSRLEDALKGRASGVNITANSGLPGTTSTVNIRGITSINGGNPLYVVDGIPVEGGIDYLNPSDIASIEVLKDGASAAIYGTKAGAGVIIVSTKKGAIGKIKLNFNGYYGFQQPERRVKVATGEQYAILRNESFLAANPDKPLLFSDPKSFGRGTDWQDQIFNNSAPISNQELSINGGNDKSTFYISAGHYAQDGIVLSDISKYRRYTMRINSSHKIFDWLTFSENISYAKTKNKIEVSENNYLGGTPLISALNLDPLTPVVVTDPKQINAEPYLSNKDLLMYDNSGNPYGISKYVKEMANPLAYAKTKAGNFYWGDKFAGSAFLEAEPIKDLKLRSTIGFDYAFWGMEAFNPRYYLNEVFSNRGSNSYNRDMNKALTWIWTNTMNYERRFGLHQATILLGTEAIDRSAQFGLNGNFLNLPVDNFKDASLNFPTIPSNTVATGWEAQPYTMASYFVRGTYNYDGRYLFTGVVRRDGSSHFGRNNLYATFPAVSLGWVLSKEPFLKNSTVVNFLKLRVGYGVTGNENIAPFLFVSTVGGAGMYVVGDKIEVGNAPQAPANQDLKWERIAQSNIGLDGKLFDYFNFSIDYYQKKTSDMLLAVTLPSYLGATASPYGNIASMRNNGVEVELGYQRNLGGVGIDVSGNASYVRNEITDLGVNAFFAGAGFQAASYEISRKMVGQPMNFFYGFQNMGIFQSATEVDQYRSAKGELIQPEAKPGDFKWADLNQNGKIDADDRTYLGDPTPHWTFGLNLGLKYKDFDMKIFGQGVAGNKIFQQLRRLDLANANYMAAALDRWTGPGTSDQYPRLTDNDLNGNFTNPSSFYLHNGAFFRIKTLQLGYNFPTTLLEKINMSHARVYLSGNNLFTFTEYDGYDPEIGGGLFGIDRGIYPQARSFTLGLNITF
ncbi:TonB-dependent receptor [Sphingobacterium thalpophilum]|uniref:TonB-dependent receptor n=1 Tax=Sphingobacterium thalpophilum TaxID=259 RepID=A0ACD5C2X7_9SPHI